MSKIYSRNTWLDRIITGALRYDIKDNGGTSLYTQVQILLNNAITQAGSALTAAWMNNIESGVDAIDTLTADKLAPITTGGTSTAFTLTTIGASALATGETWRVIFNATAGATPTLNRDSKGAKALKYYDGTGTKQSCGATTIYANVPYTVQYDGTDYVVSGVPISASSGGGTYPFMSNGKISVTVASSNLTLSLKTWAGTDPSAGDPVTVFLDGAQRTITSALSVTMNAGTNWASRGSTPFATQEGDWFAFLGYNATDGVVIAACPVPYPKTYSKFSTTATNQNYAAISTTTHAAATDEYAIIGRFAATLSAAAGYTWTVPTFTADNLVQYPITHTRPLAYTPTITSGSGAYTTIATAFKYRLDSSKVELTIDLTITNHGTAAGNAVASLPFTPTSASGAACREVSAGKVVGIGIPTSPANAYMSLYDSTTPWVDGYHIVASCSFYIN